MPVCTPLGQGLSAQLLVEEGNGKPPHHHPSSHFPSLDDTGVSPLSVITDLPYGRALIIIIIIKLNEQQVMSRPEMTSFRSILILLAFSLFLIVIVTELFHLSQVKRTRTLVD